MKLFRILISQGLRRRSQSGIWGFPIIPILRSYLQRLRIRPPFTDECAAAFGMEPWHPAVQDALDLLCGKITRVHNYDLWEKESVKDEEHPLAPYHVTEPVELKVFPQGAEKMLQWRED